MMQMSWLWYQQGLQHFQRSTIACTDSGEFSWPRRSNNCGPKTICIGNMLRTPVQARNLAH
jgi:hypothetical protein